MLSLTLMISGLTLIYWLILEWAGRLWKAIPTGSSAADQPQVTAMFQADVSSRIAFSSCQISVVVVVRNEEANLPRLFQALARQSLSHHLFELHLVDDASTDAGWQKAEACREHVLFPVHLHKLQMPGSGGSPKKAAIAQVLPYTKGAVIAVTDGDCQPEAGWLSAILAVWQLHKPVFVSGLVRYVAEQSLFERMQTIDFAALIGVGAAMIQAGRPGMCNAANMAFSKKAFLEVGGYAGNEHVPSGDDEFLLQKLAGRYPAHIKFLKNSEAIVSTRACLSWRQFLHQRKRWAGKWRLHKGIANKAVAFMVFFFYLLLLLLYVIPLYSPALSLYVLPALLLKSFADYRFLSVVLYFLKKRLSLKVFLLLELIYPFYVLFFAVAANFGSFSWKERTYRYSTSAHERARISSIG